MIDDEPICGWTPAASAATAWQAQPAALMLEPGGFLERDDCGLLLLENA